MGGELRRYHTNLFNHFASRGFLNFPNFQSFLTGTPDDVFVGSGITDRGFRALDVAGFFQDDLRLFARLTLNLGIRWDFLGASSDIRNRLGNFDPSLLTPQCLQTAGNCLRDGFVSPAGLPTFGTPGVSKTTLYGQDLNNWAPRVGLAWDVLGNGRVAVRSGYGVYFVRTSNQTLLQLITAAPFFQLFRLTGTGVIGTQALAAPYPTTIPTPDQFPILPVFPQFNGFSAAGAPLFINPATGGSAALLTLNPFERSLRTPYTQHWNMTVQWEFLRNWIAEVGYLGSRGVKLIAIRQANAALLRNAQNPGLGGLTVNSSRNANARVPVPGFSATGLNMVTARGESWYNAAFVSLRHNFAQGFSVKADYTLAKSLDNNSGAATQDLGNAGGNQHVLDLNKGLSIFDQKHRFVVTYLWEVPGPKSGPANWILGGWSLSGVATFQSGFPFSVTTNAASNLQGQGSGTPRANLICSGNLLNDGRVHDKLNNYIVASCFTTLTLLPNNSTISNLNPFEGPGTETYTIGGLGTDTTRGALLGNSGRGILRNPFQKRWDMAVTKRIPVGWEQGNLEFRAEFFNVTNTPVFAGPATNRDSPSTFGRITSTVDTTGRVIQFALKFNF
jgi:hypothetical protein